MPPTEKRTTSWLLIFQFEKFHNLLKNFLCNDGQTRRRRDVEARSRATRELRRRRRRAVVSTLNVLFGLFRAG